MSIRRKARSIWGRNTIRGYPTQFRDHNTTESALNLSRPRRKHRLVSQGGVMNCEQAGRTPARQMPITGSLALFGIATGRKLSLASQNLGFERRERERERKKRRRRCTYRIGYHELSRRTVASEGGQPVDLIRNPHRFEFNPRLAKWLHEPFIRQHPIPISFPRRLCFPGRRRNCI